MGKEVKQKILVMSIGTGLGGIEKSMIDFLWFLSSDDTIQIDLFLWRPAGILYNKIPPQVNILKNNISPVGIRNCQSLNDYISYIKFRFCDLFSIGTKALRKLDTDYDIAIAYCQVGYTPHYIIDKVSAKKKFLFYHHGSYEANKLEHFIDKAYYKAYDGILTMSDASGRIMKHYFPECENKIYSCSPLINDGNIKQQSKDHSDIEKYLECGPILVTVARLSPEKGIINALKAAKILRSRGYIFKWLFIGRGAEELLYKNYISTHQLDDVCVLVGGKENPYPFMSIATIYIQPSLVESFGITIREAAVLNRPIIASDIPALREASHEIDNMRLTLNDAENLANIIGKVLSDKNGLEQGDYNTSFSINLNESTVNFLRQLFSIKATSKFINAENLNS